MWIVDDDGDMFNTTVYRKIIFRENNIKMFGEEGKHTYESTFHLSSDLDEEERLTRYYDLVEKLTGERIDE